ncbi:MAG: methionine--tRNA ligase [Clostridia bacterium]|nr:methionine--tRNA ligase [Clostridia bacterium]
MANKGTYYITTPIYYPSSNLHIGHTYCTVMADAMARFKRASGYDVRFLTGTDEHGQKIQTLADEKGVTPQEYVDNIVAGIKDLWKTMEISYDDFIRTTEDRHMRRVQQIFMKIYESGDIYKGHYEGLYCTPCESFWTESQLKDGKCPDCGRPVVKAKEEAYFFKLSKYSQKLLDLYDEHPEFLEPESRRNEMRSFIGQGLEDLCISRSTFDWGIPVPVDEKHVMYVWLDALSNYITALGYPEDNELYNKYWPADVHLVGKEIVRFHSVIWPAMLMSAGIPLPKKVLGHGWILLGGEKVSKSKAAKGMDVIDPVILIERYGVDALKYFLLREYTFGQDGAFTNEVLLKRLNFDLANDLGNLVSRTVSMVEKYCNGVVPKATTESEFDKDLRNIAVSARDKVEKEMDSFRFNMALEEIWIVIRRANKYIDETAPWVLAKDPLKKAELDTVMYNLAEALRVVSVLIHPFMHTTSAKIREQLGLNYEILWDDAVRFDMSEGNTVKKGDAIFPRLDIEKELKELSEIAAEIARKKQLQSVTDPVERAILESVPVEVKPDIDFSEFEKVDMKVGKIIKAERHPNADKLLVFKVKIGTEVRQIISGVAGSYTPEEMLGKNVIVVMNLKPRNLRGLESHGMIIYADSDDKVKYVTTEAEDGNGVH